MYANDFLASSKVALMSTEEIGAYILLLCHAWQDPQCSIPADDDGIRKLGRIAGDISNIRACFVAKRGRLVNERLMKEWVKANHNKQLASVAAHKRWDNARSTSAMRTHMPTQCSSPSPSPSPSDINTDTECWRTSAQRFWDAFPKNNRKIGKGAVWKWFQRHAPIVTVVDAMVSKLTMLCETDQWTKDNGKFIPLPMTWLNQGRWEDEVVKESGRKPPPPPPKIDPIARGQWKQQYGDPKQYGYD